MKSLYVVIGERIQNYLVQLKISQKELTKTINSCNISLRD